MTIIAQQIADITDNVFAATLKSVLNGTKRYSTEISAHNRPKTQVSENQKCTTRYKTVQKRYRNPKKLYRPVQNGTPTKGRAPIIARQLADITDNIFTVF